MDNTLPDKPTKFFEKLPEQSGENLTTPIVNQSTQVVNPTVEQSAMGQTPPEAKKVNQKFILYGVVILILLILGIGLYVYKLSQDTKLSNSLVNTNTKVTPAPVFKLEARAEYVSGNVWKVVDDRKTEILEGDVLVESDQIQVGADGKIILAFDDGSVVRIGGDSKIILANLTAELMKIEENSGIVFARVQKDAKHKFIVDASGVVVESQGTAFSVENTDEVNIQVFENQVKVNSGEQQIEIKENEEWSKGDEEVEEIDDKRLASNEFLSWSLKEELNRESKIDVSGENEADSTTSSQNTSLTLTGEATNEGIRLNWSAKGDIGKGFKVVKNSAGSPAYPGDDAIFRESSSRSYLWQIYDGKTWHFRVCQYLGESKCGVYSNDIIVTAKTVNKSDEGSEGSVSGITLSGSLDGNKAKLNWTVTGDSPKGFKVLYSTNSSPTYPTRDGDKFQYLSSPDARSSELNELSGGITYYVRVCEYLGGKCGVYSNEINLKY